MVNTELLEKKIKDLGLKDGYVAKKLGITQASFISKKKNQREFKASELDKIKNLLSISSMAEMENIFFN